MSCPFSGSAFVSNSFGASDSQIVSQCVSVSIGTTYDFGVQMQSSGGYTHCDLDLYPSAGCAGVGINAADDEWLNVYWSGEMSAAIPTGNAISARVSCWAEAGVNLNFDMVYLTPSPGGY
jgi:hypothetical protein